MTDFPFGETVTRVRAGSTTDPYSGEQVPDWGTATTKDFELCAVWQESSVEPGGDGRAGVSVPRAEVVTVTKAVLPFVADFTPHDRFKVRGKTYEVVGEPADWANPFTGWEPGTVVTGRRIDG